MPHCYGNAVAQPTHIKLSAELLLVCGDICSINVWDLNAQGA
jgi:hypothetical protein